MKTFSTEKHSIPEGATHYFDEQEDQKFAWWDENSGLLLCPENANSWESPLGLDDVSSPIPIPQQEAEWKNGDECLYMNSSEVHKFIGIDPTRSDFCYIKANCSAVNWVEVSKLSKPESPEEKEKRERLEAAYDLYLAFWSASSSTITLNTFKGFSHNDNSDLKHFLAVVDKANYRVGK